MSVCVPVRASLSLSLFLSVCLSVCLSYAPVEVRGQLWEYMHECLGVPTVVKRYHDHSNCNKGKHFIVVS